MSSAEAYMRKHYDLPKALNYSELQLLYNMHARPDDPMKLINKDTNRILYTYSDSGLADWIHIGGNQNRATAMLSSWAGTVYDKINDGENQLPAYTELSGVITGGSKVSHIADLSLHFNDPIGFNYDAAHIFDSEWIDRSTSEGIAATKEAIMENGAVGIRYVHDPFFINYEFPGTETGKTYYYCPLGETLYGGGHAVSAVGWDDSIAKENFKVVVEDKTYMPEANGAWLIRNSWDRGWGDEGYFWMSYETLNTGRTTAFADQYRPASWFEHNYQYDGATLDNDFIDDDGVADVVMANLFTAQNNEEIRAVSFSLLGTNIAYQIRIYTNVENSADPTSGTLSAEINSGSNTVSSGFHTVELPVNQRVFAAKDSKFSVVVSLTSTADPLPVTTTDCMATVDGSTKNNGKCPSFLMDCSFTFSGDAEYTNYIEAGQSFLFEKGSWIDLITKTTEMYNGQPRIKAFTVGTSEPLIFTGEPGNGNAKLQWNTQSVSKSNEPIRIYRSEDPINRGKLIAEVRGVNQYIDRGPFTKGVNYIYTLSVGRTYNPTCELKNGVQVNCLEEAPEDNESFSVSDPISITATEQMAHPRLANPSSFWNTWAEGNRRLPETGFATSQFTELSRRPQGLVYGSSNLNLEIPVLDISSTIMSVPLSDNRYAVEWLGRDVGLLEGSFTPGEGVSVLAGHNHLNTDEIGPFAFLNKLEENDRIYIRDDKGELKTFKVYANEKIAPDDYETLSKFTQEDALVLVSCEDEMVSGGYASRRVVFAEKVN